MESGPGEGVIGRGLKAGGFVNALMDTDFDTGTAASIIATTSSHLTDGSLGTVWGYGILDSGAGLGDFSLNCASCHDPHGRAGPAGSATYRILRSSLPITSTTTNVADESPKLYTVSDPTNKYFGEGYSGGSGFPNPMDDPEEALSAWCTQCHTRYLADNGSGSTDSGDTIFAYRHMAGDRSASCRDCHINFDSPPLLKTTVGLEWQHNVECATCHVAHGSPAVMGGLADGGLQPGHTTATDSALLRADNRGVCQRCHGK